MDSLITELKALYRDYLSNEDKQHFTDLIHHNKKAQKYMTTCYKTSHICKNNFPLELRDKIHCVRIDGIGFPLNCYENSKVFTRATTKNVKKRLGLNLFACPCGKRIIAEPHALNEIDGVFYDFTKEVLKEDFKYFIPFDRMMDDITMSFYDMEITCKKCRCGFNTKTGIPIKIDMGQFLKVYEGNPDDDFKEQYFNSIRLSTHIKEKK